ncbi:iron chaperone [Blastopirellula retiformator]|uniref:YdhG-like domain-containing protein n=1 Tax=Blastopirellula retiformator TaxID=2527970 RepID=A0A5C5UYP6_9BACT|nr:DUF1801 domain-containing protein [Blastopirellula retiformator]TWT30592.1 hypothetical protein Enr8_41130 [Blastopirellula retiformator]
MTAKQKPTTIAQYIAAAPPAGKSHLKQIYAILKSVAPDAEEAIKWNTPFFVEPRFLFAFAAFKSHCTFAPTAATLAHFQKELKNYRTTKNYLQVGYTDDVPEDLIRRMAEHCVEVVAAREDDSFW